MVRLVENQFTFPKLGAFKKETVSTRDGFSEIRHVESNFSNLQGSLDLALG